MFMSSMFRSGNDSSVQLFDDTIPSWIDLGPVPSDGNGNAPQSQATSARPEEGAGPAPSTPARAGNSWTSLT